jgi:hypothetical protein
VGREKRDANSDWTPSRARDCRWVSRSALRSELSYLCTFLIGWVHILLVALFVYWVQICYCQETCVNVEWGVFLDCCGLARKEVQM